MTSALKILQVDSLNCFQLMYTYWFVTSDAIMDMLNSENWRRAILQQCSQDRHTQVEVRRALSSTTSYDGHRNAK